MIALYCAVRAYMNKSAEENVVVRTKFLKLFWLEEGQPRPQVAVSLKTFRQQNTRLEELQQTICSRCCRSADDSQHAH